MANTTQHRLERVSEIQNALCYYSPTLLASNSASYYDTLVRELPWSAGTVLVRGQRFQERRLTCLFSTTPMSDYHYSGKVMQAHAWHPLLDNIRQQVTDICRRDYPEWQPGWQFDTALCNWYRPKSLLQEIARQRAEEQSSENDTEVPAKIEWKGDSISWHSDSERDLVQDRPIASVTLCHTDGVRRFDLRCNTEEIGVHYIPPIQHGTYQVFLQPGSLFVMGRDTQRYYMHSVPEQRKVEGGRVNITFRQTKQHNKN